MAPILLSIHNIINFKSLQWCLSSLNTQKPCLHITSSRESGSPRSVNNGLGGLSTFPQWQMARVATGCWNNEWRELSRSGRRKAGQPSGGGNDDGEAT